MTRTEKKVSESELRERFGALVELAAEMGIEAFGSAALPKTHARSTWLVPEGQGRHGSRSAAYEVQSIDSFWDACGSRLKSSREWNDTREAMTRYLDNAEAKPCGVWMTDPERGYLEPSVSLCLERAGSLHVNSEILSQVLDELVAYVSQDSTVISSLLALEEFSAESEFLLGENVRVRPIRDEELRGYGVVRGGPIVPGFTNSGECPRSDWWMCEMRASNPKGTYLGWNYAQSLTDKVRLGLHMFKNGRFSVIPLRVAPIEPFGRDMSAFGGLRTWGSSRGQRYSLSSGEIEDLSKFWPLFLVVMGQEKHYLQLPARRLDISAARPHLEDAIVDCVVGLESLLSSAEERTELRYRFSVRGSVVLAEKPEKRPQVFRQLRALYDLRSAIVHGTQASIEELEASVDFAEQGLRTCWKWYLSNYPGEKNGRKGVERIDEILLLRS